MVPSRCTRLPRSGRRLPAVTQSPARHAATGRRRRDARGRTGERRRAVLFRSRPRRTPGTCSNPRAGERRARTRWVPTPLRVPLRSSPTYCASTSPALWLEWKRRPPPRRKPPRSTKSEATGRPSTNGWKHWSDSAARSRPMIGPHDGGRWTTIDLPSGPPHRVRGYARSPPDPGVLRWPTPASFPSC